MFEEPANIYYKKHLFYMITRVMDEQKFCKDCNERKDCQKVYQQLGGAEGPSVLAKVIIAFLLPLLVFIGCLAIFGQIFSKTINIKELQTPLSLLAALSVTLAIILIIRIINRQPGKNR